uniref:DUF4817 domain-containing protein n=1 Tax=Romanomermis culicivorax TaxID=13658 RepID=A0A915IPU5_ROMCU
MNDLFWPQEQLYYHHFVIITVGARLSLEEKIKCVHLYSTSNNAEQVVRDWHKVLATKLPETNTVLSINRKFEETGRWYIHHAAASPRPRVLQKTLNHSRVRAAAHFHVDQTAIQKIPKENGLKAYRPTLVNGLLQDDYDRCMAFC